VSLTESFGRRVIVLRKQAGYSQEYFAELCGLHRTAIGLIERGKSMSRLDTMGSNARTLHIDISGLLRGL